MVKKKSEVSAGYYYKYAPYIVFNIIISEIIVVVFSAYSWLWMGAAVTLEFPIGDQ